MLTKGFTEILEFEWNKSRTFLTNTKESLDERWIQSQNSDVLKPCVCVCVCVWLGVGAIERVDEEWFGSHSQSFAYAKQIWLADRDWPCIANSSIGQIKFKQCRKTQRRFVGRVEEHQEKIPLEGRYHDLVLVDPCSKLKSEPSLFLARAKKKEDGFSVDASWNTPSSSITSAERGKKLSSRCGPSFAPLKGKPLKTDPCLNQKLNWKEKEVDHWKGLSY